MNLTSEITWINTSQEMPDADAEVLILLSDESVETGYYDGQDWKFIPGVIIWETAVLYWAEYPAAPNLEQK